MKFLSCNLSGFQTKEHCSFCHVYLENMACQCTNFSSAPNCVTACSHISCRPLWSPVLLFELLLWPRKNFCVHLSDFCSAVTAPALRWWRKFTNQRNQSYSSSNELFTASFQRIWFKSGRPICQPVLGARLLSRFFFFLFFKKRELKVCSIILRSWNSELQIASNSSWQPSGCKKRDGNNSTLSNRCTGRCCTVLLVQLFNDSKTGTKWLINGESPVFSECW